MPDTALLKATQRVTELYNQATEALNNDDVETGKALLAEAQALIAGVQEADSSESPTDIDDHVDDERAHRERARHVAKEFAEARMNIEQALGCALQKLALEKKEVEKGLLQLGRPRQLVARSEAKRLDIKV